MSRLHLSVSITVLAVISSACPTQDLARSEAMDGGNSVVATIDGASITLSDLDAWLTRKLFEQEVARKSVSEQYDLRSKALEEMINERVIEAEAERRGVTTEEVVEQAETALGPVSDDKIAAFFEKHRTRFHANDTLERRTEQVRRFLESDRRTQALAALRADAEVRIELEPPRVEVTASGPSIGPEDAPVTIVEFSDYQCPFCGRAEPIVKEVLKRYPEKIRLVFRHFPLESIHPRARAAAEASVCAEAQGKFWEYHEQLFANQRALDQEDLANYADALGLDRERFEGCTQASETRTQVQGDLDEGASAGVQGTPAFFINGIPLSGARPVGDFVKLIDQELARQEKADAF